ncbi:MAG: radical SAM protein [Clostridiales bacterium]|jgi:pyruvate formate lyase activating enzyme|nr:radical SAM protein [Clostridiales bacterium]
MNEGKMMSFTTDEIQKNVLGYVNSIESLGALDGPGLRTVFFLQGCPVKCIYCHNPEMQDKNGGRPMSVIEIVQIAQRNRPYFGKRGGVTFSGGEPLMQPDFVLQCILECKKLGIHTVVDTSGVIFDKCIFDSADLILLDIKHTDSEVYRKIVGCAMDNSMRVLDYLSNNNIDFIVRHVVVGDLNDDVQNIKALKKLANKAIKIELLPYHAMAMPKYEHLGWEYPYHLKVPSEQKMKELQKIIDS